MRRVLVMWCFLRAHHHFDGSGHTLYCLTCGTTNRGVPQRLTHLYTFEKRPAAARDAEGAKPDAG
jgi:hypothetical protein